MAGSNGSNVLGHLPQPQVNSKPQQNLGISEIRVFRNQRLGREDLEESEASDGGSEKTCVVVPFYERRRWWFQCTATMKERRSSRRRLRFRDRDRDPSVDSELETKKMSPLQKSDATAKEREEGVEPPKEEGAMVHDSESESAEVGASDVQNSVAVENEKKSASLVKNTMIRSTTLFLKLGFGGIPISHRKKTEMQGEEALRRHGGNNVDYGADATASIEKKKLCIEKKSAFELKLRSLQWKEAGDEIYRSGAATLTMAKMQDIRVAKMKKLREKKRMTERETLRRKLDHKLWVKDLDRVGQALKHLILGRVVKFVGQVGKSILAQFIEHLGSRESVVLKLSGLSVKHNIVSIGQSDEAMKQRGVAEKLIILGQSGLDQVDQAQWLQMSEWINVGLIFKPWDPGIIFVVPKLK